MKYFTIYSFLLLLLLGCRGYNDPPPDEVMGFAPVYKEKAALGDLSFETPRPITAAGKIYTKGNLLYQIDEGTGIHVISIADPANPERLGFIPLVGAQEISILHNSLYTNSGNDLVILDITTTRAPELVSKIDNAFSLYNVLPPESGFFECVNPSKGVVAGWEKKLLKSPGCRR